MQKIYSKLKEKKGASLAIEIAVMIIVIMMIVSLVMTVLEVFFINQRLTLIASETTRYIEIKGEIDSGAQNEFNRLAQVANMDNAEVKFSTSGKIPLEEEFTVTVSVPHTFGIGSIITKTKKFSISYSGRGEVYWK